jgi:hypothetical protein
MELPTTTAEQKADMQKYLTLFHGDTPVSKHFLLHLRKYNNHFSMVSMVAKYAKFNTNGTRPVVVEGDIQRLLGPLLPEVQGKKSFVQLFMSCTDMRNGHAAIRAYLPPKWYDTVQT